MYGAPLCPQHSSARYPFPSFSPLFTIGTDTAVFLSRLSSSSALLGVDLTVDTAFIDRGAVGSDHSSNQAQALEGDGLIQTPAERELQVACSEELRQEEKKMRLEEECQEEEPRRPLAEKQRTRQYQKERRRNADKDLYVQHGNSSQRSSQSFSSCSSKSGKRKSKNRK